MRSTSLRARLVALLLLLLAVAGALIGTVTTLALRAFLLERLDSDLRAAGGVVRQIPLDAIGAPSVALPPPQRVPVPDVDRLGPGVPLGLLVADVADGRVLGAGVLEGGGVIGDVPADALPALLAVPADGRPVTADLAGLGRYRLISTERSRPDGTTVTVITGQSERPVQDTVATLIAIEAVAVAVALLGAGVAGAVAVRRSLRPLEEMAATASRVSALPLGSGEVDLAERVPVTDARDEVGQVGAALNRMLDHVDGALRERHAGEQRLRRFVADASHELRTPLAAIRGYAELTRREPLPEGQSRSLERISASAERMSALVEDLLLLARLDAGRPLERVPVDLTQLVVDAVADAHAAGPGHRFALDLPDDPVAVPGDALRLTQVVTNLLANARAHTPPGTAVAVSLVAGPEVALTVADTGPGIAPDLLPRIFERFARGAEGRSREHGSTGLGLAIVHAVVTAHGGRVDVASRPGRTAFTVRLPALVSAQPG
jgi:two-component system OmpR family sensor kinase